MIKSKVTKTILIALLLQLLPGSVLGISAKDKRAVLNDTVYYDPDTVGCNGLTSLSGSDNEEKAFNFFVQKGFSSVQAAGIIGNMMQESHVTPTRVQGGGDSKVPPDSGGWGITQWTPGSKVLGIADAVGVNSPIYELATQLEIVWREMDSYHTPVGSTGVAKAIKQIDSKDVEAATLYFEEHYEGAGTPVMELRYGYARQALAKYGGKDGGSSASSGNCGGDISGYKNPLRDVQGLVPMRIDQGVDYGGSGPIYAIGKGEVVISTTTSGWPGGNFISYRLTEGPAKGKYVYFAENCTTKVKEGDDVDSETVICNMINDYPHIETGWATDPELGNLAAAYDVYTEGDVTAYGVNFSEFLQKLGAPPGVKSRPEVIGSLPQGWPQW